MWLNESTQGCRIVAEVGQNHDGSLGAAHAYIDAVARTGADTIKFQTHIASAESTAQEPWRKGFSQQDKTRFDYWRRMEFTPEQWYGLAQHAREQGLSFLSSAFSFEAVELLEGLGMEAWKVGAGEITNLPMIERMARTGKPVLLSSGLASWHDLDLAVEAVRTNGAVVGVLQCTTMYPCPPEKLGLNLLGQIRARYGCPTGLSDHSGKVYAGLAAAARGAQVIEVHVTFSRECFGPDVPASLTTAELAQLVEGVRFIEDADRHPADKAELSPEAAELRRIFGKSIVAARGIPKGVLLTQADLAIKKPGVGIPAAELPKLVGRRTLRALETDSFVAEEDLGPACTA